jgi:hypothetical protein
VQREGQAEGGALARHAVEAVGGRLARHAVEVVGGTLARCGAAAEKPRVLHGPPVVVPLVSEPAAEQELYVQPGAEEPPCAGPGAAAFWFLASATGSPSFREPVSEWPRAHDGA